MRPPSLLKVLLCRAAESSQFKVIKALGFNASGLIRRVNRNSKFGAYVRTVERQGFDMKPWVA